MKKPESAKGSSVFTDELALDEKALSARVFRPVRARVDDARAAVVGVEDPAEAWEALAARGIIPAEWMGDGERVFAEDEVPPAMAARGFNDQPTYEGVRRYLEEGPRLCDVPPTAVAAWTLASDVEGLTTAERVAREAVRRLAEWGAPQPTRVCWRIVVPLTWETQPGDYRHMPAAFAASEAFVSTPRLDRELPRARSHEFGTPAWRAAFTWECAVQWRFAARGTRAIAGSRSTVLDRLEQGGYPTIPAPLRAKRFSEVPSPFEPLLSLWASGYALDAITPELIVIAAPQLAESRGALAPKRTRKKPA